MFGMGFTEILLIAVIAILFLGPDKLPSTMVEIAKFFRNMKQTIGSVKNSIEEEMSVSEIKEEALAYKRELLDANEKLSQMGNIDSHIEHITDDIFDDEPKKQPSPKDEAVTFKKEKKKKQSKEKEEVNV